MALAAIDAEIKRLLGGGVWGANGKAKWGYNICNKLQQQGLQIWLDSGYRSGTNVCSHKMKKTPKRSFSTENTCVCVCVCVCVVGTGVFVSAFKAVCVRNSTEQQLFLIMFLLIF